jgi:hypothetical protein
MAEGLLKLGFLELLPITELFPLMGLSEEPVVEVPVEEAGEVFLSAQGLYQGQEPLGQLVEMAGQMGAVAAGVEELSPIIILQPFQLVI